MHACLRWGLLACCSPQRGAWTAQQPIVESRPCSCRDPALSSAPLCASVCASVCADSGLTTAKESDTGSENKCQLFCFKPHLHTHTRTHTHTHTHTFSLCLFVACYGTLSHKPPQFKLSQIKELENFFDVAGVTWCCGVRPQLEKPINNLQSQIRGEWEERGDKQIQTSGH